MKTWQEDQLNALQGVEHEKELFEMMAAFARDLGFDHCAYGLRAPLPLTNPKTIIINNYPFAWQTRYQERNYLAVDPTVQHAMRSLQPVVWSDKLFQPTRDLWEDARSFGLTVGWAQSSRDENGMCGLLTLARSGESLSDVELREKDAKMVWLAQVAHLNMSRLLCARLIPEIGIKLSSKEIEVLKWTGDGKTSGQIADILNISESAINKHLNNAALKLNASNKTAAVVRAAVLGMLF